MQHWHTLVPLQGPGRPGRDRHAARSHHLAWYGNIINGCSRRFCPRPNHRPHTTPPPAERWLGTRATRAGAVRSLSRLHTDTTNVPPAAAAAASAVSWSLPIRSHPCTALARARARRGHSMDNKGYYIDHVRACGLPAGKPVVSRSQNVGMHVAAGQERARSTPLYALSIARRTSCARFLASLALSYRARPPAHQLPASRRFHQPCACVYRPKEEINGHRTGL